MSVSIYNNSYNAQLFYSHWNKSGQKAAKLLVNYHWLLADNK